MTGEHEIRTSALMSGCFCTVQRSNLDQHTNSQSKGPYCISTPHDNGATLIRVDQPVDAPIRVALNRLHRCPKEIAVGRCSLSPDAPDVDPHGSPTTTSLTKDPATKVSSRSLWWCMARSTSIKDCRGRQP